MRKIKMFIMTGCPHCANAKRYMEELYEENPGYKKLGIEVINETNEPELANQYDYYYVPTYYLEGEKFHEGVPKKKIIEELFKKALNQ
ncbi:MAG: glutaredoxin [Clostridiales bacterium]|nr:glutaredoxin [Clostridiales bacterium]